ncbi:glucosidase [Lithospermum erythrorhizon]|uniref:glucan endo-1,3-beta-D-glucosidase n=1 Tax=Lithospermum erythrorhizon TaxID=34254 RepID=A0AAV3RYZ1_LITER
MMRAIRFCLIFLLLLFFISYENFIVRAFTGTYGINYGRIADNIPSPDKVVSLLRAAKIKNVRIYDSDHSVLNAFRGTGLELVVGLNNGLLKEMSSDVDHALDWVKDNVMDFLSDTKIVGIFVGNEILGNDNDLSSVLMGAVKNVYNATKKLGIDRAVQITTAHSMAVLNNTFPPSYGIFRESVNQFMKPLLEFFSEIGSPFCLNAYPFLVYTYEPGKIDINYALFEKNKGIVDNRTNLHYDNLLDAQIDAAYAALEAAGYKKMEVIITETGWASHGDQNEPGATVENAKTYNFNLRKRLAKRKGTPLRPKSVLKAYIFALFNEDLKTGATSEKNFGLFKPDGSIAYNIGFSGMKSSSGPSTHLALKGIHAHGVFRSGTFLLALFATLFLLEL